MIPDQIRQFIPAEVPGDQDLNWVIAGILDLLRVEPTIPRRAGVLAPEVVRVSLTPARPEMVSRYPALRGAQTRYVSGTSTGKMPS